MVTLFLSFWFADSPVAMVPLAENTADAEVKVPSVDVEDPELKMFSL